MIKFDKSRKIELSSFRYQSIRLSQVQRRIKKGVKHKILKIQGCFEYRKEKQGIKGPRQNKFKQKRGSHKNRMFWFEISDGLVFLKQIESD
jgi:hypothetical protein